MKQFFGKYRGKVANNIDPLGIGRVQVSVPAVYGDGRLNWAQPCAPFAGQMVGFFAIPPIGANIWVEFEGGDPDYPIYSGGFWGMGETPALSPLPAMKVISTDMCTITLNDVEGSVVIETLAHMKIAIDATGITLDNGQGASISLIGPSIAIKASSIELDDIGGGKLTLTGPRVSINDGALEVL